jgi:AAA15 family ATPase/GTPase
MIISFSVQNYRSIYQKKTLEMTASKLSKKESVLESYFSPINYNKLPLLKSAVIYGANASGKSNFLKAMYLFKMLIVDSIDYKVGAKLPFEPFRLFKNADQKPTSFELDFIANDNIRYVYGFTYNVDEILEEHLISFEKKQRKNIFTREKNKGISFGKTYKGQRKSLEEQLLSNNLFLTKAANSNNEILHGVYKYFAGGFNVFMSSNIGELFSKQKSLEDNYYKKHIGDFLKAADTGIESFYVKKRDISSLKIPEGFPNELKEKFTNDYSLKANVSHYVCTEISDMSESEFENISFSESVEWDMDEESSGTRKLFGLSGVIIDILNEGTQLIVDEINNSLHPDISKFLVNLFNNKRSNPKNAQLIFSTHDTSLLSSEIFRRDQIWFTEKNPCGVTDLFSLCTFDKNKVRSEVPFDKWYLSGRFGAVPSVQDFQLKI